MCRANFKMFYANFWRIRLALIIRFRARGRPILSSHAYILNNAIYLRTLVAGECNFIRPLKPN